MIGYREKYNFINTYYIDWLIDWCLTYRINVYKMISTKVIYYISCISNVSTDCNQTIDFFWSVEM